LPQQAASQDGVTTSLALAVQTRRRRPQFPRYSSGSRLNDVIVFSVDAALVVDENFPKD